MILFRIGRRLLLQATHAHAQRCHRWASSAASGVAALHASTSAMQDLTTVSKLRVVSCCNSVVTCSDAAITRNYTTQRWLLHQTWRALHNKTLVSPYTSSPGLAARQNTQALDAAIYRPNGTSYQLQPSFHTHSTEPEPTARARRAGKEFY